MSRGTSTDDSARLAWIATGLALVFVASVFVLGTAAPTPGAASENHLGTMGNSSGHVYVFSSAWNISTGPKTTTPPIRVLAGSQLFVFIGYVNDQIGGGSLKSIGDTKGFPFSLIGSSGTTWNHTELVYTATNVTFAPAFRVTVAFSGGVTVQGATVAVVDVAGQAANNALDVVDTGAGPSGTAVVPVPTHNASDFFLFGVSGQWKDIPFNGTATHERPILSGGGIAGPFTDGECVSLFSHRPVNTPFKLEATENQTGVWAAVGVGILP
jgi:hypothetical protein